MTPKERVLKAIYHEEPDRVPLNVWFYYQAFNDQVVAKYGSLDAWYDEFGIDMFTVFPSALTADRTDIPRTLDDMLAWKMPDPWDDSLYEGVRQAVEFYGGRKRRAVFCQTGAVFEGTNGFLGMAQQLVEMALSPDKMRAWYAKLADWYAAQSLKAIECGVDVVHMSDDWGQNNKMIISPKMWWELIFPADKVIVNAIKSKGVPASLHSCGYFMDVLDGCVEMGLDVLNPFQTSAGMDPWAAKERFGDRITIYGGLDVRETLPRASLPELEAEVKRLMDGLKPGGGFILCTAHSVQDDISLEHLESAYRWAADYGRYDA